MPDTMLSTRNAIGGKLINALTSVELMIQEERRALTDHIANVTSQLKGLRRCFKSSYDLVGGSAEVSYRSDTG